MKKTGVRAFFNRPGRAGAAVLLPLLLAGQPATAQVITNAYDTGANYVAAGNFNTGDNLGAGFGPWTLSTPGGGNYLMNAGGGVYAFAIWNNSGSGLSTANRTFSNPLPVGGSFSMTFRLNNLDNANYTNGFYLQDASGNILFTFYHQGGDNANGHYRDAGGLGTATGFTYNYSAFSALTFTLNSASTYTFTDNTTGASFNGTLSGAPITQVTLFRANGSAAPSNGQDLQFNNLAITTLGTKPVFTVQPKNQAGFSQGAMTLTALATAQLPITYQWYHGTSAVSEGTGTNLALSNLGQSDAGSYYLVATDSAGATTSSVAVVTVLPFGYTNAYDVAANYGGFFGNQGFGFGPWTLSTAGGGSYISGDSPARFSIWNSAAASQSTAVRPFSTPLEVGGTFLVKLRISSLDTADSQNGFQLQDASGNVLFSYWHQGGDDADGHYSDASGAGTAAGFAYDYQQMDSFAFVLNSATTYTFVDVTTGASFSGTLAGSPITQVTFLRANLAEATANGQDLQFDDLVTTTPNGVAPGFSVQPRNQAAMAGSPVSLTAIANSSLPITYQWYKGDTLVSGATTTNLAFASLATGDAGTYKLVAANAFGSSTSAVAVVTVIPFGYTNAFDFAAQYSGFSGNQGFGFGTWTLNTTGGGSYLSGGNTPLFTLWNNSASSQSTAVRPFSTPLAVGGSFLVQLRMNNLDNADTQNGMQLQDADGNVLFSYWHQGGDNADGHYLDAGGGGAATGFAYDYQQADGFAFTLTSASTYTFTDLATGACLSGTLAGTPITQVTFYRSNLSSAPGSGLDFQFNNLILLSPTLPLPAFTVQPISQGTLAGGSVSLLGVAVSPQPITYQWYTAQGAVAGATSTNLALNHLALADARSYWLVAENAGGRATSAVASITVFVENNRFLAYEGFDYADPPVAMDGLSGGFGWNGGWKNVSGTGNYTQAGSLLGDINSMAGYDGRSVGNSYYNYGSSRTGRFLDCSTNGAFSKRGFIDGNGHIGADGKTLYLSFLMQPAAAASFYEFEFHRSDLGDGGRIGGIGNDTANPDVYLRAPKSTFWDLGAGDTAVNLYVVRIDFKVGNDDVRVYRNPTSLTEPATATVAELAVADMSFDGISLGAFGNYLAVDEIRVGATWEDVIGLPVSRMQPLVKAGQGWTVNFAATPGLTYRVQTATSVLGPWTDLDTVTGPESGLGTYTHNNPPAGQSFYRVVTP
jgi:hypothetical protein